MTGRVLVVQPDALCPPGRVGAALSARGVAVDVVHPYVGEPMPELEHDGLVVLGGTMGAYDDRDHPWLIQVKALLARAADAGLPTLGICLGHQLLAVATGGAVVRNPDGPTAGVQAVRIDPAGRDELHDGLAADAVAIHWNNDVVIEAPPGAVPIARTPDGHVQAMRLGEACWGVQFHPEADFATVRSWAQHSVERGDLDQPEADRRLLDIRRHEFVLDAVWSSWAARFGRLVGDHGRERTPADGR